MATTISVHGHDSELFPDIPFYYAFKYRLYFGSHQIAPDDIETWAKEYCTGYFRTRCYTHESSKRDPQTGFITEKVVYADCIYLQKEADAATVRLAFEDVKEIRIKRPKLPRLRRDAEGKPILPGHGLVLEEQAEE